MVEGGNKSEIVAGGGHIDVAARLVGLRLEGESISITASYAVLAKVIDGFAQAFDGVIGAAAAIRLDTFAATPQNEDLRTQLSAEVHRAQGLLQGVGANLRIVGGK